MTVALAIAFRFLHIGSAIVILGAALFGAKNAQHRKWVVIAAVTILLSGLYNFLAKSNVPAGYHMYFGIKMLFALHVLAVCFLLNRPATTDEKRLRLEGSLRWSGAVILLLSAYLRYLSGWMIV
jgi:hypothetical protein